MGTFFKGSVTMAIAVGRTDPCGAHQPILALGMFQNVFDAMKSCGYIPFFAHAMTCHI